MNDSDISTRSWKPASLCVAAGCLSGMLSVGLCIVAMRIAVGPAAASGGLTSLSPDNLSFALCAGCFVAVPSVLGSVFTAMVVVGRATWFTVLPVLGLPLLGASAFALLVIAGLG